MPSHLAHDCDAPSLAGGWLFRLSGHLSLVAGPWHGEPCLTSCLFLLFKGAEFSVWQEVQFHTDRLDPSEDYVHAGHAACGAAFLWGAQPTSNLWLFWGLCWMLCAKQPLFSGSVYAGGGPWGLPRAALSLAGPQASITGLILWTGRPALSQRPKRLPGTPGALS